MRCAGFCGSGARGTTVRFRWYSVGSGTSVVSFIPHRGQLPAVSDRMSLSLGQIQTNWLEGSGTVGAGVWAANTAEIKTIPRTPNLRMRFLYRRIPGVSNPSAADYSLRKCTDYFWVRDWRSPAASCLRRMM